MRASVGFNPISVKSCWQHNQHFGKNIYRESPLVRLQLATTVVGGAEWWWLRWKVPSFKRGDPQGCLTVKRLDSRANSGETTLEDPGACQGSICRLLFMGVRVLFLLSKYSGGTGVELGGSGRNALKLPGFRQEDRGFRSQYFLHRDFSWQVWYTLSRWATAWRKNGTFLLACSVVSTAFNSISSV